MKVDENIKEEILSKFTTQRDGLLYEKFQTKFFRKRHFEAFWFFNAFDYVQEHYLELQEPENESQRQMVFARARSMMTDYLIKQFSAVTMGLELDFLIALSGEVQEQRSAEDLSVVIIPSEECFHQHSSNSMIAFAKDDKKALCHDHVHAVRKQLSLAKDGGLAVCKDIEKNVFYTVGVLDISECCAYPRIVMKRHLEWEFHMPTRKRESSCRIRYKQGTVMMPFLDLAKEQKLVISKKLKDMGLDKPEIASSSIAALLPVISKCDHGAIAIFLEEKLAASEAKRLTSFGRGLLMSQNKQLFDSGEPDEMLIKRMASIDGAIIADFDGNCYAYGVILDGKVTKGDKNNKDRGARYNSTKTYLDSLANTKRIGIVRSEDGMLNIFP